MVAAAVPAAGHTSAAIASPRPNILFILTDDQRWDELQYMPELQSRLIDRGIEFTNGFVSNPLCCPSRATILTGQYSSQTGVWSNSGTHYGGWQTFHDSGDEQHTIATVLYAAGYDTAMIGKYMNGYETAGGYVPPGWNRWFAMTDPEEYFGTTFSDQGMIITEPGSAYQTDVLGQQAVDFIQKAPTDKPLFLYWAPHAPHLPSTPAPEDQGTLAGELSPWRPPSYNQGDVSDKPWYIRQISPWSPAMQAHWDALREKMYESLIDVDRWIANILEALRSAGRLRNTLVVFTSDNGFLLGEHRWAGKVVPYEESIRVPWIVRWDAASWPHGTNGHFMLNTDFATTFARVAGTNMSGAVGGNFARLLRNPPTPWRRHFPIMHGGSTTPSGTASGIAYCGIRAHGFMYAQYWNGFEELYDLPGDVYELRNVAGDAAYLKELQTLREEAHGECNPPPPGFTWTH